MRNSVNLADRKAVMDILKQLYAKEPRNGDDSQAYSHGESGAAGARQVDKDATEV